MSCYLRAQCTIVLTYVATIMAFVHDKITFVLIHDLAGFYLFKD